MIWIDLKNGVNKDISTISIKFTGLITYKTYIYYIHSIILEKELKNIIFFWTIKLLK